MAHEKNERVVFVRNLIVLFAAAFITLIIVNRGGGYPWGSDTYGHLFKGNILYDSIKNGRFFLNYNESWYNGVQPFRYWAPLPYYILALINLATGNIIATYNVFIILMFILGGLGWLCWGYYLKRQNLGLVLALLWFFVPNNLRILFSEGNIPYVLVNNLVPYIFLYHYKYSAEKKVKSLLALAFLMGVTTLSHAMLSAMMGISLFILACCDVIINKRWYENILTLIYGFLGIMAVSFWLYPALKGGIMSIDKGAVSDVMNDLTYPLTVSLNPLLRFSNVEVYYYGLAFALAAVFGVLMSRKYGKAYFISALVILLATTRTALPLFQRLPMNQLFWMSRLTSISMGMIIMAVMLWKSLRKSVLAVLILLLIADSGVSFYKLGITREFPREIAKTLDNAAQISEQRIGVLDGSHFGSFPSYYIGYNSVNGTTNQVYGWAWQGAATSKNIVMLNIALEEGYYGIMFDRALELGADTLIVKKSFIENFNLLDAYAGDVGYTRALEDNLTITYKYPVEDTFGTRVEYEGIAIGTYSANALYLFPKLKSGQDNYIDSYTYDELKDIKLIYLAGFKYRDKKAAEDMILKLSRNGVKVVIDATGLEESFLDVRAEPVAINTNYKDMYYKNEKLKMVDFPAEYTQWKTSFLQGIENKESYQIIDNRLINYIGNNDNDNLVFIGLNLPYYAFLTKDKSAVRMLEDTFGLKAYEIPEREVYSASIKRAGDTLKITGSEEDITIPVAALDAFIPAGGKYTVENSLIHLETKEAEIKIGYPYFKTGMTISIIVIVIIAALSAVIERRKS